MTRHIPLAVALALAGSLALGAAPAAHAQAGNDPRPPTAPGPTLPAPQPGDTLSDQLRRNDGVIPPPRSVDPDMHKPAPDTGTMPVIPPPDGNGSVQPK